MSVKAEQILALLDNIAPFALAEEWDNVGLLAGSRETEVETVLCALDLTEKVLDEALEIGAQMIVTHHPVLFRARRNLCADDAEGRLLVRLAGSGLAMAAMHTNFDNAHPGVNDALAAGERVCKGRLKASNPYDSWVSGGYGLYHALMEWVYSRPHAAAGMSSNLVGTGFVVHRDVMDELGGWNTETICEDSEFAAICARIGVRIAWVYEALSYDEQVTDFKLSLIQRVRWCRGMVMTARRYTKDLLRRDCPNRKVALDFAMVLILSHTAPLSMLLSILSLPFQNRLMLLMTLGSLALSIVGMIFLAILLCILGGYSVRRMLPTILLYPLYTASWFPLQLAALFLPIRSWKPIPHQGGEVEDLAA